MVVEISTRKAATREQREIDLAESLAFARHHLSGAVEEFVPAVPREVLP